VVAVLGPTNTGKTHLAMERLLGHPSGMIGFPLRLLARENYERAVKAKGEAFVALVTGEEKIIPSRATHWICTVESMPVERPVQFLAVDEIQLCADPERGHIFTDRLLHARGMVETMFLGAATMRPLIRRLVPGAEFVERERLSNLSWAGERRLTRLPPRSAVVAFSATDVYALAETLRNRRGGTAVVLGALSPRTRNAQVAMYQAGEVDYLVATDAIGMGLNMDVDHVAFARMVKFDGAAPRRLRAPEVAQIAGRAGRHTRDGTFGTTEEAGELDEETIERVENHEFENLAQVMWRNSDLRFDSVGFLLQSLERRSERPELIRAGDADDHLALKILARDAETADLAKGRGAVKLLWDVCRVPDFRKLLSDAHTRLLAQLFKHLRTGDRRLPVDWTAQRVSRLDNAEGDIDTLVSRIAHIRTWTYIAHHQDWLDDPAHWRGVTRTIEDKLSDALHERLTQRFVDRRSASLARSMRAGGPLRSTTTEDGRVEVEGHLVGRLEGFRFLPDAPARSEEARALLTAARRALGDEIARRVRTLEEEPDTALTLNPDGTIDWRGVPAGRLVAGSDRLSPSAIPDDDGLLDQGGRERVRVRLDGFVKALIARRLAPLFALARVDDLGPAARGVAFQLRERLGVLPIRDVDEQVAAMTRADRAALKRLGVEVGFAHVFAPDLTKPAAVALSGLLWAVHAGLPLPAPVPDGGRVSVVVDPAIPPAFWPAIGYPAVGRIAVRVDMLDRFEAAAAALPSAAPEIVRPLGRMIGRPGEEVGELLRALGWTHATGRDGAPVWRRRPPRPRRPRETPLSLEELLRRKLRL